MSGSAGRRLVVEADGGSRGNPGVAGYGALVRDAETGQVLVELAEPLGTTTNNVAEYRGLIAGLQAAAELDAGATVEVRLDSNLVVKQMNGENKVKHPNMRPLALEARDICSGIQRAGGSVTFRWVPREKNKAADALSNDAMDGKTIRRVLSDQEPPPARVAPGRAAAAGGLPRTPLRLLLVQVPQEARATPRVVRAVRNLVGGAARVLAPPDGAGERLAYEVADALGVVSERADAWAAGPGQGPDEQVQAAYRDLTGEGGTVVVVTSRRGVLSVLADVLGTPAERFWGLATAPGSLTAVEVWEDGTASVAFTNRTDHLA